MLSQRSRYDPLPGVMRHDLARKRNVTSCSCDHPIVQHEYTGLHVLGHATHALLAAETYNTTHGSLSLVELICLQRYADRCVVPSVKHTCRTPQAPSGRPYTAARCSSSNNLVWAVCCCCSRYLSSLPALATATWQSQQQMLYRWDCKQHFQGIFVHFNADVFPTIMVPCLSTFC